MRRSALCLVFQNRTDKYWITHTELKRTFAKKRDQERAKSAKVSLGKAKNSIDRNETSNHYAWSVKGSEKVCNVSPTKLRVYNPTLQYGFRSHNYNRKQSRGDHRFDPSAKRLFVLSDKSGVGSEGTVLSREEP